MFYVKVKSKKLEGDVNKGIKMPDTHWRVSATQTKEAAEQHLKDLGYEVIAVTTNFQDTLYQHRY